jgi:hypothetical protein
MKIDPFTLSVLENFAVINPAVWINEGNVLETVSPTRAVVARVNVEVPFPKSFGLYRLHQFIQVLNLYHEPDVTFEDTHVLVSSGLGGRSTKITYGDPTLFGPCQVPDKMKFPSSDIKTSISSVVLRDLAKAARVLGVEDLVIEGNGKYIAFSVLDTKNTASNYHTISLGETDKKFKAIVKHSNMTLLPHDYDIEIVIKGNPQLKFTSDRIKYLVAVEEGSEF